MSKVIVVDYGHGGSDPGAVNGRLREKDLVLQIGRKATAILRQQGIKVVETRTRDQYVSLARRTLIANRAKADLFVSIHINSFSSPSANGVETFSYPDSTGGAKLAKNIQDELVNLRAFKSNRGVKTANFYVLRKTSMPAVLVELGFIKNPHDIDIMTNKQGELAQAVVSGILKELGKNTASKPSKPSKPKPKPNKPPSTSASSAKLVKNENGRFTVTASGIKVRTAPSTSARQTGMLKKGNQINYDAVYEGNGYRWLRYRGASGNVLYVPYRPSNDVRNQWGTFGGGKPKPRPSKKSSSAIAKEVIAGKWGNGAERKKRLRSAGYHPDTIQKEVDRQIGATKRKSAAQVADEIYRGVGEWGTGNTRVSRLKNAGHNPTEVQRLVNKKFR